MNNRWSPSLAFRVAVLAGVLPAIGVLMFVSFPAATVARYEHFLAGRALADREFGSAQRHLEAALRADPHNPTPHDAVARLYWQQGQTELAETHWEVALERNPRDAEALSGLGTASLSRGQPNLAIERFRASMAEVDTPAARVDLANALAVSGQVDEARDQLHLVVDQVGERSAVAARARFMLGVLLLGDDGRAATESFTLAAESPEGRGDLLQLCSETAAEIVRSMSSFDGESAKQDAYRAALAGYGLLVAGYPAAATDQLEKAVRFDAAYPDAFAYLGYSRLAAGDLEGSSGALDAAIALAPRAPLPRYLYGLVKRSQGALEEAIASLRQAVLLDPDNASLHVDLARTLEASADYAAAAQEYEISSRLTPGDVALASEVSSFYQKHLFRPVAGLAASERLAAISPEDPKALDALGWARYLNGDVLGARAALQRGLAMDGAAASLHYHLGVIAERGGDAAVAAREYRRVLDLDLGNLAALAKERLEGLASVR